jgi:hypothetical protein
VSYEELPDLEEQSRSLELLPLGLPSQTRPRRTLPRQAGGGDH